GRGGIPTQIRDRDKRPQMPEGDIVAHSRSIYAKEMLDAMLLREGPAFRSSDHPTCGRTREDAFGKVVGDKEICMACGLRHQLYARSWVLATTPSATLFW
ncbi:hypothetical protein NKI95_33070, partial [Mesorhizobium sp. M0306]|uniref:hypothetical protein n=1 Tax=Mesorhizobium sp. M0306 TaxID=2956932 RepID=UPI003335143E